MIYIACSGYTNPIPVYINVLIATASGCAEDSHWYDEHGRYHENWNQDYQFNLYSPNPYPGPLTVYYQYTLETVTKINGSIVSDTFVDVVLHEDITAPNVTWPITLTCKSIESWGNIEITRLIDSSDVFVIEQPSEPSCLNPPITCFLGFTEATPTDPSNRGLSDGQIYATITGATGTTIEWKIDGIISSGTTTGHTFTGLTTGTYTIKATEDTCWVQTSVWVGEGEFRTGDFTVISPTANGNIVAVENPIMLNLATSINSLSPTYSINTFTVTGTTSNVTIDFALVFPYEYSAEFMSKAYPDRSNYFLESILTDELGVPQGNNTTTEIATSLAEVFQKDPIISRIYYISSNSNVVTLKSKEYGSAYDLSVSNVTISGTSVTLVNTQSGIAQYDGQLSQDYSLYSELFVDDNIQYGDVVVPYNYKRVLELELPFANDNVHQFDLSSTLKNFVASPKFSFNFTGITYMGNMFAGYYCKYGEKYPLVANSNTKKKRYKGQIDYGYCINSALNFEDPNTMNYYLGTSGATITAVPFMNTAPDTKFSHRNAIELMYFIIPKDYPQPLAVYGNIYMYDGSSTLNVKFFDITVSGATTNFGGVAVLSVGYDVLGLSSYETAGNKIRKVEIQVKDSSTLAGFSLPKSYLLEIDEQPDTYNVAFLNKLGTYETYSFIGELQENEEIVRSTYQRPYPIDSDGAAAMSFQYNTIFDTSFTKIFVANTGIISEDEYYYLMGLLQSNRIYNYDSIHQNYIMVLAHIAMKSTNTNEYSIQITFKETISENNVSI